MNQGNGLEDPLKAKQGECQFPKEMDVGARTNLLYVRNVSDLQARGIHSKCESLQVQVCTGSALSRGGYLL